MIKIGGIIEGVICVDGHWGGECPVCSTKRLVTGYALFYAHDGKPRGWAGWGPHGEQCPKCGIRSPTNLRGGLRPMPMPEQEALHAAFVMGGMGAVRAMLPEWSDG